MASEAAQEFLEELRICYAATELKDYIAEAPIERVLVGDSSIVCLLDSTRNYLESLELTYVDDICYNNEQNIVVDLFGRPEVAERFMTTSVRRTKSTKVSKN